MKTLHVIRNPDETLPFELGSALKSIHENAFLLIHDGVYHPGPYPKPCYVSAMDLRARGMSSRLPQLNDEEVCGLMVECDRTVIW